MSPEMQLGCIFFLFGFLVTSTLLYIYTQCIQLLEIRRKLRIMMHNMNSKRENMEVQV